MRSPILKKQVDWSFVSVILAAIIAIISAIGWGVSVETRLSQHASLNTIQESVDNLVGRTQNIEKLLLPVIVDYKVRKEVEERMLKHDIPSSGGPLPLPPGAEIRSPPVPIPPLPDLLDPNGSPSIAPMPNVQQTPEMIHNAEKWAKEQILKGQQTP